MVIHIRRQEDVDLVIDLTTQHSMVIVAMLDSTSNEELRLCLSAGARACVSPDWGKDELVLAIKASPLGMAVIPSPLAQSMACSNPTPASPQDLSVGQVGWLNATSLLEALSRPWPVAQDSPSGRCIGDFGRSTAPWVVLPAPRRCCELRVAVC